MLPEFITHFAVGPLLGLAANGAIAILCLVTLTLFPHYRPLRSLSLFYLFIALIFLGLVVCWLQKSPESILLWDRIIYAALVFLPAIWFWFYLSLFNEKPNWLTWIVTGISFVLASLALFGRGPLLFGLPMEPDPFVTNIFRPQSKLLKPLIHSFCLALCLFYLIIILARLGRLKEQRRGYLIFVAIGLLFWLLGGLHDAFRTIGVVVLYKDHILWFASLWLSIFLTIAVTLHFRSVERAAREGFERLNKVKSKALDHLSHELRTPLCVIKGNIHLLRRMIPSGASLYERGKCFETIDKQLTRLTDIQKETDKIIRHYHELERNTSPDECNRFAASSPEPVSLYSFAERVLEDVKQRAAYRKIDFYLGGPKDPFVLMDSEILEDVLEGLLKNAIENTPDEGMIRIQLEREDQKVLLKVQDFGIGITEENQRYIFDGLFHTQETDLYTSKRPYDFGAGGKGLTLLQMKIYGQRFDFDLWVESRRCAYLPTDRDSCTGKISSCPHCQRVGDCMDSGGSTFYLSFPVAK
jgi:signal transduction histidine kinase